MTKIICKIILSNETSYVLYFVIYIYIYIYMYFFVILQHLKLVAFFTLVFGIVAMAFPMPDDPYHKPTYHAAPHHGDLGRVKIQVRAP